MRFAKSHWRALRRYLLVFTAIALLPLALVYLVRNEQFYKIRGYEYINETHTALIPQEAVQSLSVTEMQHVQERNQLRRKYLQEKCTEFGLDVVGNDSWHKPNAWEFLVNRKHHIIWCNVFKAASSSWMFNFNVLAGYSPEFLHKTKEVLLNLARERYPRVSLTELLEAQNDSFTFIIARHPFERLLSAYRDKFVFAIPHSYHDKLGRRIVRLYRKPKNNEQGANSKYPTFSEFVRYLLDQIKFDNYIDMHFVASTKFCTPCLINFDVILKFETLEQDQLYLIEKTGLKRLITPEWRNAGKGKNTLELLHTFFSQLTLQELQSLYNYYKYDFQLFNYSATSYFNIVHAKNVLHEPEILTTLAPVAGAIEEQSINLPKSRTPA